MALLLIFLKVCKQGGYKKKMEPNDGFVISNKKILSEVVVLGYNLICSQTLFLGKFYYHFFRKYKILFQNQLSFSFCLKSL